MLGDVIAKLYSIFTPIPWYEPSCTPAQCCPTEEFFSTVRFFSAAPSFFLHCGHNFHKDCIESWLFKEHKGTCRNCRGVISNKEKGRLQKAFSVNNTCALCNSNSQVTRLPHCSHYICAPCKNKWASWPTAFSSKCPGCFKIFIKLFDQQRRRY